MWAGTDECLIGSHLGWTPESRTLIRARFERFALAVLAGPLLCLPGCATDSPEPAVKAAATGPFIHLSPPHPRPKRRDPCKLAKVDLSSERKEALFKQFAAESGSDVPADQATAAPPPPSTTPAPASSPECRPTAH